MDPLDRIRNGFANGYTTHSHFYVACGSRHESSMIPKALEFATLQKKWPPNIPHVSFGGGAILRNLSTLLRLLRLDL